MLTHLDWSQMRLTNKEANSFLRISIEQAHDTAMKHSAQAFRTPHTPSSHRYINLLNWKKEQLLISINHVAVSSQKKYFSKQNVTRRYVTMLLLLHVAVLHIINNDKYHTYANVIFTRLFSTFSCPTTAHTSPKLAAQTLRTWNRASVHISAYRGINIRSVISRPTSGAILLINYKIQINTMIIQLFL